MASVRQLSASYANFMLAPRAGPDVCRQCFNLTDGYDRCYACARMPRMLDTIAPISYSVAHEQLHHVLASYKRMTGEVARRMALQLAAVLWRFLDVHEPCVARAANTESFPVVTTVPSSDRDRDECHPLRWIVSTLVAPTRDRYDRLLLRSSSECDAHVFSPDKFVVARRLRGEPVLLVDDTLTTGANVHSAAAALREAGAGQLAAVVIGRHVNRDWHRNDLRLRTLTTPFDWDQCAWCHPIQTGRAEATAA